MKYYLNGIERDYSKIKVMAPRKIQEEAITRIQETIKAHKKILINMPCRTGKTFTDIYSCFKSGIELIIVLCGKTSAKASYNTDSVWKNKQGEIEGYNKVFTNNKSIKDVLKNIADIKADDKVLIEITPQLLNRNKELIQRLNELTKVKSTVFSFDEAHFTEQTAKTKEMVETITQDDEEDKIDANTLTINFSDIPWIYLTASPDTQSLQDVFNKESGNYYELTKEREWELYQEDLKLPEDQREFNYVPVRNCLYIMNKLFDSVYNSAKSTKQDYTSLFTMTLARRAASKFVLKSLIKTLEIINNGPDKVWMSEDPSKPYARRGSNVNLMIKVPVNSKKTNTSDKTVAQHVEKFIRDNEAELLKTFPEFTSINIKDATLVNNISQEQANEFFDSNPTSINIILTQQRLIEGTTLYNLDAFLYYCTSGSLCKYKQESGRTLTPSTNKNFGFIFFFDEDALANVKALLLAKITKLKGGKKHGTKKLSVQDSKKLTRVSPAFIIDGNDDMKLIDYSKSLYTKSDLENTRVKSNLFDKNLLFAIPGLKDLIANLLTKMSGNTTKKKIISNNSSNSTTATHASKPKAISPDTPIEQIELEKFVNTIIYLYQDCIQNDVPTEKLSNELATTSVINSLPAAAIEKLYNDTYTYGIMMEIAEVLENDQEEINDNARAC